LLRLASGLKLALFHRLLLRAPSDEEALSVHRLALDIVNLLFVQMAEFAEQVQIGLNRQWAFDRSREANSSFLPAVFPERHRVAFNSLFEQLQ